MKKENAVCGCCGYLHFSAVGLSVARYCNIAVIATALVVLAHLMSCTVDLKLPC